MSKYEIEVSRTAEKQLKNLPKDDQLRLARSMLLLSHDPFPKGARKLTDYDDVYRIRVGRYRILYSVSGKRLIVIILKIAHRKHVYR